MLNSTKRNKIINVIGTSDGKDPRINVLNAIETLYPTMANKLTAQEIIDIICLVIGYSIEFLDLDKKSIITDGEMEFEDVLYEVKTK